MSLDGITLEIKLIYSGQLRAFVDVIFSTPFGEIKVLGFRVLANRGSGYWVAFPSITYLKNGKSINKALIEVPLSLKSKLADLILRQFEQTLTDTHSFQPSSKV